MHRTIHPLNYSGRTNPNSEVPPRSKLPVERRPHRSKRSHWFHTPDLRLRDWHIYTACDRLPPWIPSENPHFDMISSTTRPESHLQLSPSDPPSLTSSPSIASSTISSPRFHPEDDDLYHAGGSPPFIGSHGGSMECIRYPTSEAYWEISPVLYGKPSPAREILPTGSPTFHAPTIRVRHPCTEESQSRPVFTSDFRPAKRPRHLSNVTTSSIETPRRQELTVIAIPPAQASDLPFDPTKKPARRRGQSSSVNSPCSTKGHKLDGPTSFQPVKFRFVSVHHSAHPVTGGDRSSSAATDDMDVKVEFEEHMEDVDDGSFEHGPSELPPRPYPGGEYAISPLQPKPETGKISAGALHLLPNLEARFARLERVIERYVEYRGQQALRNSLLPEPYAPAEPAHASAQETTRTNS